MHHLAFWAAADSPKGPTWIHLVADHFSPLVVGQLPCRLWSSVCPSGVKLHMVLVSMCSTSILVSVCSTMTD